MVLSDTLLTIFEARGASSLISTFTRLGQAQDRLAVSQDRFARASTGSQSRSAWLAMQNSQRQVLQAQITNGGLAIGFLVAEGLAVRGVVDEYVNLGNQIMNIRDLTGSSSGDALKASLLAGAGGIKDPRMLLDLNKSVFGSGGQLALARLGIAANPNQSGLALFDQVANALDRIPNGLRKAQIMEQIFGTSGAQSLMPLLRLTKEQRQQVEALTGQYGGDALQAIQQYQFASNLLGLTWQQKVIAPLATQLMPALETGISLIGSLMNAWSSLNDEMHGGLGILTVFVGGLLAIGSAAFGIISVVKAFALLNTVLGITDTLAAIFDFLSGNWIAIGAAVVAAAAAIWALMHFKDPMAAKGSGSGSPVRQFGDSVNQFEATVNRMGDSFDTLKGAAIPKGLQSQDLPALSRQFANGLIG